MRGPAGPISTHLPYPSLTGPLRPRAREEKKKTKQPDVDAEEKVVHSGWFGTEGFIPRDCYWMVDMADCADVGRG
jgi:hypothetical protein